MKKTVIALAVAFAFVLALAIPVLGQSITHNVDYELEGDIESERYVGHKCNTGAEMEQYIVGQGKIEKSIRTNQVKGKMVVSDVNDWTTAPDAVQNLSVATRVDLCTPPKMTYKKDGYEGPVHPWALYRDSNQPRTYFGDTVGAPDDKGSIVSWNNRFGTATVDWSDLTDGMEALTDQVWATGIVANPGERGFLATDFDIAYGPYLGHGGSVPSWADAEDLLDTRGTREFWTWALRDGALVPRAGSHYVGDYVNIDSMAFVSDGELYRKVDISSPWSGGLIQEDTEVIGFGEVEESLRMVNIAAGSDIVADWLDRLFN